VRTPFFIRMGIVFGLRSWYSKQCGGFLSPAESVEAAKKAGATALAFSDLHEFGGVHEWLTSAKQAGLTAMCGVEVLLDWDNARLPALFFGRGADGARRISQLLSRASIDADERLIVTPLPNAFSDLIACTGGATGHFNRLAGRRDLASLQRYFSMMGETGARMLIGVDPANDDPYHLATVKRFEKFAVVPYRPLIYRSKADHLAYSDVSRVISKNPAEECGNDFSIQTMESMAIQAKGSGGYCFDEHWISILNRADGSVGDGFAVVRKSGELFLSGDKSPAGALTEIRRRTSSSLNTLVSAMEPGAKGRYEQRLDQELQAVQKLNMSGYLLALSAAVKAIRAGEYPVGRGRGSSINSLVCRLLEITQIDPVEEDLPFERFLNVNRDELPDVDIDVSRKAATRTRSGMKASFAEAYGLRTFVFPTVRAYLPKVMQCKGVKPAGIEGFKRELGENSPEARTWDDVLQSWPEAGRTLSARCGSDGAAAAVLELMAQVGYERPVRSMIHEAGIAVCARPMDDIVAVQPSLRDGKAELCVACPAKTAVERGVVKIDVLPLDCLDQLKEIDERLAQLETGPVFTRSTRAFNAAHGQAALDRGFTAGIFQFGAQGDLLAGLKIRSLDDLTFAAGLVRVLGPGGSMPETPRSLEKAPNGLKEVYHQITAKTRGLLVFQEQLMKILVQAGRMSYEDAEKMRRAVAKKTGESSDAHRSAFAQGCAQKFGVNQTFGENLFDELAQGGRYLFNEGHARSYSEIAAAQIVAKVENTSEAFVAMSRSVRLQSQTGDLRGALGRLVYECRSLGMGVEPVDLTPSGGVMASPKGERVEFSPGVFTRPSVRMGLDLIPDINNHQIKEARRQWNDQTGLPPARLQGILRDEQVVNLICLGAWDKAGQSREALLRTFLRKAVTLESHAAYERQSFGYLTDAHHPGLPEGAVPVAHLHSPGFIVPKSAFAVGGFITEVTDVSPTSQKRSVRASIRLTNYLGARPVDLSTFFASVRDAEVWVQRHRAIDSLARVSLLVEAREAKGRLFFNVVGDAVIAKEDKSFEDALSMMRKHKSAQLHGAPQRAAVCYA
jgi:DNA polymerase III alpha subunit